MYLKYTLHAPGDVSRLPVERIILHLYDAACVRVQIDPAGRKRWPQGRGGQGVIWWSVKTTDRSWPHWPLRTPNDAAIRSPGWVCRWYYDVTRKTRDHVGLMLGQRLRRWPNINPTWSQRPVFVGMSRNYVSTKARCLSTITDISQTLILGWLRSILLDLMTSAVTCYQSV